MLMSAYLYDGDPRFILQYGGNGMATAQTIDPWLVQPLPAFPEYCHFNQAQNAGLVAGVTLTGATSGAVITVGKVALTQGTISSAGMGVLFYRPISGHVVVGENLQLAASTYCVSGSAQRDTPLNKARSILVAVETNAIRYCVGGPIPTTSAGTPASFGVPLSVGQIIVLSGEPTMDTFSWINAVSASNAVLDMVINF